MVIPIVEVISTIRSLQVAIQTIEVMAVGNAGYTDAEISQIQEAARRVDAAYDNRVDDARERLDNP